MKLISVTILIFLAFIVSVIVDVVSFRDFLLVILILVVADGVEDIIIAIKDYKGGK